MKKFDNTLIEIELYNENSQNYVYISHDGSSGVEYVINSYDDIGNAVSQYIEMSL